VPTKRSGLLLTGGALLALLLFLACGALALRWMTRMPGRSHDGPLPPPTAEERARAVRLERHVRVLADEIGARSTAFPAGLAAARDYLAATLEELGYEVAREPFESGGATYWNLVAERRGAGAADLPLVLVGAHYDAVHDCPGANDNATGVAALLELARDLRGRELARTVRLVLFANEEPPFFGTEEMGSRAHARGCRVRGEELALMLSLETLGCYSDEPGSQRYPFPFGLVYPDRGDFVAFVANTASRAQVRRLVEAFRESTPFPSEGVAAPAWIPGIDWSDHGSFWKEGYPAVMVTDTAPFRYAHYHTLADTPDEVDFERLARVTAGVAGLVAGVAGTGPR